MKNRLLLISLILAMTGCCSTAMTKTSDWIGDETAVKSTDLIDAENPDSDKGEPPRTCLFQSNCIPISPGPRLNQTKTRSAHKRRVDNNKGGKKCQCPRENE